jgi:hypothetical protein
VKFYQFKLDKNQGFKTRCLQTLSKYPVAAASVINRKETKSQKRIYHDETLVTFFRRLAFSPEGSLLFTPAGLCIHKKNRASPHCAYIYSRASLSRYYLPLIFLAY